MWNVHWNMIQKLGPASLQGLGWFWLGFICPWWFWVKVDAARVAKSSQISLYHCLLDGKPREHHEGAAFLQVPALLFADSRQVIVQRVLTKFGDTGSMYCSLLAWPPLAGIFLHAWACLLGFDKIIEQPWEFLIRAEAGCIWIDGFWLALWSLQVTNLKPLTKYCETFFYINIMELRTWYIWITTVMSCLSTKQLHSAEGIG